ncbi:MAG TPA: YihY/virulence factor BrkB family protein [Chloroflexia bacterium]|nr:YihY/virulence factor BrkB family protein [Chloroflexia bacterium]
MSGKEFVAIGKATIAEFNKDDVAYMAAALTYYSFFSLFPLLILAITLAGSIMDPGEATVFILSNVERVLPGMGESLADILENIFENRANAGILALVGLAALTFSASGAFDALDKAINRAWNSEKVPTFLVGKLTSFAMMAVAASMLIVSFVVTTALAATRTITTTLAGELYGEQIFWQIVNFAASIGLVFLVFALMYRFLPRCEARFRDVWLGALLAAIAWSLVKEGFAYYLGSSFANYGAVYGPLATVIALMTWIYISSVIILAGTEFASETARFHRLQQTLAGEKSQESERRRTSPWLPNT